MAPRALPFTLLIALAAACSSHRPQEVATAPPAAEASGAKATAEETSVPATPAAGVATAAAASTTAGATNDRSALPAADAAFEASVRPVLSRTCAPCHNPGGKMYERLPFDDPGVVRGHADSILKRLKAPEDREAFQRWMAGPGAH